MVYKNLRDLAAALDVVVGRYMLLNYRITDTENQHTLMVFRLVREGYKLHGKSSGGGIKSVNIKLDDIFGVDEHLQELDELCRNSIDNSKRYMVHYE